MKKLSTQRPSLDSEPWARVRAFDRFGPFAWHISVGRGVMRWGPDGGGWFAWTEAGARRKAVRKVAAMKRWYDRQREIDIDLLEAN
jgi:hypothetical protein